MKSFMIALCVALIALAAVVSGTVAQPNQPIIYAAGDIATGGNSNDTATGKLLTPATHVLTLGDNAYPDGTLSNFNSYFKPTWGPAWGKTYPAPGNHEYHSNSNGGYFDYFAGRPTGARDKGYYSYTAGTWTLIALNTGACGDGRSGPSCGAGSAQEVWLRQQLAAADAYSRCTLVYYHHPRWNTVSKGNNSRIAPIWNALVDFDVDVVLNGHEHQYQRHLPRNKTGGIDQTNGTPQFTVGTGGAGLYQGVPTDAEVYNSKVHGVLRLDLWTDSYNWKFIPVAGQTWTDAGWRRCHGSKP